MDVFYTSFWEGSLGKSLATCEQAQNLKAGDPLFLDFSDRPEVHATLIGSHAVGTLRRKGSSWAFEKLEQGCLVTAKIHEPMVYYPFKMLVILLMADKNLDLELVDKEKQLIEA